MNPVSDPHQAFRLEQAQKALESSATARCLEMSMESMEILFREQLKGTYGKWRDVFGPPREIWPAKSWLQNRLEQVCDRVLLVWDALLGRTVDFDGLDGVQLRDTNLDRLFRRRPSPNPEYEAWRAKQADFETAGHAMRRRGEEIRLHRPHRYVDAENGLTQTAAAASRHTDEELRWADDGGAIA